MAERLQKVMAQAGVASRRASEQLILDGKVTVNGKTVRELGTKVEPSDKIAVSGEPIDSREKLVYFLLNKPRGVVTTNSDDKGRATVMDIVDEPERVYPVGRLDYDTTGVLLLTNDGELANKLMHPRYRIDKVYVAKVKGIPTIVKLTIHEGKYHQVKEMMKAVGHEVLKLTRERYGMLDLTGLTPGEYRPLRYEEVQALKAGKQYRKSAGRW